jgi:hypothetical protein
VLAGNRIEYRLRGARRGPKLDDPGSVVERCGEVDHGRRVVVARCVDRRSERAGGVHDEQVARTQEASEITEPRVLGPRAFDDEQAHAVAR